MRCGARALAVESVVAVAVAVAVAGDGGRGGALEPSGHSLRAFSMTCVTVRSDIA